MKRAPHQLSSNGTTSKSTPIHTPVDPSSSGPSRQYASATHHHYPARPHHYTGGYRASQAELEANAHAAYESISALLSASQYPVMDELGIMRGMDLSRVLRIQTSLLLSELLGHTGGVFLSYCKMLLGLRVFFKNFV